MAELTRRAFFGVLGAAAAGMALDPERLLWRPGAKTIFIPSPARVIAASSFTVGDVITIPGRYAINPLTLEAVQTRAGKKFLQQFVVTADVSAGQEILTREVCPRIALSSRSDWGHEGRTDYFNGEPLAPGDHRAEPFLVGETHDLQVEWMAKPAGPERGFVLAPPDLRRHRQAIEAFAPFSLARRPSRQRA